MSGIRRLRVRMPTRVLFVCSGNICRSPSAHAMLAAAVRDAGLDVEVDSAGIGGWHAGELPEERTRAEGARRGYVVDHPARQVRPTDLATFDLVIAMDRGHQRALERLRPPGAVGQIVLYRSFEATADGPDVEDPYYGGEAEFVAMFDVLERGLPGLLRELERWGGA